MIINTQKVLILSLIGSQDLMLSWTELDSTRTAWHKQRLDKSNRLIARKDEVAKEIAHSAMEVTQVSMHRTADIVSKDVTFNMSNQSYFSL